MEQVRGVAMGNDFVEEMGLVVAVQDGDAWVETQRRSACHSCSANTACGSGILSRVLGSRRSRVRVRNSLSATVGDSVILGLNQNAMLRGSLLVYGVPLLLLIGGAVVGTELGQLSERLNADILALALGVVGFVAGVNGMKAYARRLGPGFFEPRMLRLAASNGAVRSENVVVVNGG